MGRYGRSVSDGHRDWRRRSTLLRLAVAGVLLWSATAMATPDPKVEAAKKAATVDVMPAIEQLGETQRALAATLLELREQLSETQRALNESRDETREKHEAAHRVLDQVLDQVEGMRKEVWGLYVENSGLKGDIAQAGKQVEGLDESLASFRLSAGIVVAIVIVLQLLLVGLTFRGRG